jgi:hypothetical protein
VSRVYRHRSPAVALGPAAGSHHPPVACDGRLLVPNSVQDLQGFLLVPYVAELPARKQEGEGGIGIGVGGRGPVDNAWVPAICLPILPGEHGVAVAYLELVSGPAPDLVEGLVVVHVHGPQHRVSLGLGSRDTVARLGFYHASVLYEAFLVAIPGVREYGVGRRL